MEEFCGRNMIPLFLGQQKLSEKLYLGLGTSPLLPSDPRYFTLHSIQRGKSKSPCFQLCLEGRSTHPLKMSGSSEGR